MGDIFEQSGWGPTSEFANIERPRRRRRNPFAWRGYLTRYDGNTGEDLSSGRGAVEIRSNSFKIGRHPKSDLVLASPDISREHACITRIGNVFHIEDLGSRHGTYVNGDRVLSCRLTDGDILQFGYKNRLKNTLYFDRAATREATAESDDQTAKAPAQFRPKDRFTITFWGSRGSIPTPGPLTDAYGGNTTCVELRYGEQIFVLDAGTGICKMSQNWVMEFGDSPLDVVLMFSHLHWDHIQGFPFFSQAYQANNRLRIYGADDKSATVRESLKQQMQGQFFPVPLEAMQAKMEFCNFDGPLQFGDVKVSRQLLPHPGGAYAYRFETSDECFIFATDCELEAIIENQDEVRARPSTPRRYPEEFLRFFEGADYLVLDCQYSDELYANRHGWGHNSLSTAIDFTIQVDPMAVALTHHDPQSTDADVRRMVDIADASLRATMKSNASSVLAAREEMTVLIPDRRRTVELEE
ncbi:MAG: FHA domain-containing protein [Planctomycetaceae bacterium]|nr:FHA domain-containing protein [Planctomycetaceae bacterium]